MYKLAKFVFYRCAWECSINDVVLCSDACCYISIDGILSQSYLEYSESNSVALHSFPSPLQLVSYHFLFTSLRDNLTQIINNFAQVKVNFYNSGFLLNSFNIALLNQTSTSSYLQFQKKNPQEVWMRSFITTYCHGEAAKSYIWTAALVTYTSFFIPKKS